jgi:hypothetical protein
MAGGREQKVCNMVGASTHHQLLATKSEIMVGDLNPLLPAALEKYEGIYIAAICPRTSAFLLKRK